MKSLLLMGVLALAACDGASGPGVATFDAIIAGHDLTTSENAIDAVALDMLSAAAAHIDSATGTAIVSSVGLLSYGRTPAPGAALSVARTLVAGRSRPLLSRIGGRSLSSLEGQTLVYDLDSSRYVVSNEPGAPSGAVRFALYQSEDEAFVQPLARAGWVDIYQLAEPGRSIRLAVTVAGQERLNYVASRESTTDGITASLAGTSGQFAFELVGQASVVAEAELQFEFSYAVTGASRRHSMTINLDMDLTTGTGRQRLTVELLSPETAIALSGELDELGHGTLAARTGGSTVGQVTRTETGFTATRHDGAAFDASSSALLENLLESSDRGLLRFDRLREPVLGYLNQ